MKLAIAFLLLSLAVFAQEAKTPEPVEVPEAVKAAIKEAAAEYQLAQKNAEIAQLKAQVAVLRAYLETGTTERTHQFDPKTGTLVPAPQSEK